MNRPRLAVRAVRSSKNSMRPAILARRLNSPGPCGRAFFRNYL
jgi:hypothetical protein